MFFCGEIFSENSMSKHFNSCEKLKVYIENKKNDDSMVFGKIFRILIQDSYWVEYWIYIDVSADLKLEKLDHFLRKIWVECCGHLSDFIIDDIHFESFLDEETLKYYKFYGKAVPENMNIKISEVIRDRLTFEYRYDFGWTTSLKLKVKLVYDGFIDKNKVTLLARNILPQILCDKCGKPATKVCTYCSEKDGKGFCLCDDCAPKHKCGEEYQLPVVNSPRVGICRYTGELDTYKF